MIWWIARPGRALSERAGIAELEDQKEWLRGVTWEIGRDGKFVATFEIEHLNEAFLMTISYPSFFPDTPPLVCPKENVRLSGHQYGPGGELCLEYRPENWDPAVTGAMMIESAYRLITGERPAEGAIAEVESAHRLTIGQEVRSSKNRFFIDSDCATALSLLPIFSLIELEITEHMRAGHWLAFPQRFGSIAAPKWVVGPEKPSYRKRTGYVVRLTSDTKQSCQPNYELIVALAEFFDDDILNTRLSSSEEETAFLIECDGEFHFATLASGTGKRSSHIYRAIFVPADAQRLPTAYARLAEAKVAIIGCGSVGSKIAASLARTGIQHFLLIDGDILFPGNLVRNDLDWQSVGLNKVDALSRRIKNLRPSADVTTRHILLGGQESAARTESALSEIAKCDVIIDATADPQIFNLCGAVARAEKKILVWGEIFGGGFGGFVMRLRPDVDPVPHSARSQLIRWCADHGRLPPAGDALQYGLRLDDTSPPLIADDAEVSLIASHMARLTLDAVANTESIFPYHAYAIGLKNEWIFDAPFDTWPILLALEGNWGPEVEEGQAANLITLAAQLFPATESGLQA